MSNHSAVLGHQFLLDIMHDPAMSLHHRIDAAGKLIAANLGDNPAIRIERVIIDGGIPADADLTKAPEYQLGVCSDAGKAPGHRPPRKHRGFYVVKSA